MSTKILRSAVVAAAVLFGSHGLAAADQNSSADAPGNLPHNHVELKAGLFGCDIPLQLPVPVLDTLIGWIDGRATSAELVQRAGQFAGSRQAWADCLAESKAINAAAN